MSRSAQQRILQAQWASADKFRDDVSQEQLQAAVQDGVVDPMPMCVPPLSPLPRRACAYRPASYTALLVSCVCATMMALLQPRK